MNLRIANVHFPHLHFPLLTKEQKQAGFDSIGVAVCATIAIVAYLFFVEVIVPSVVG